MLSLAGMLTGLGKSDSDSGDVGQSGTTATTGMGTSVAASGCVSGLGLEERFDLTLLHDGSAEESPGGGTDELSFSTLFQVSSRSCSENGGSNS